MFCLLRNAQMTLHGMLSRQDRHEEQDPHGVHGVDVGSRLPAINSAVIADSSTEVHRPALRSGPQTRSRKGHAPTA
jgi:hypothetical protein